MYEVISTMAADRAASPRDLESRVEYWHTHDLDCSLREYLGMEKEGYELWMKYGDSVLPVIARRGQGRETG